MISKINSNIFLAICVLIVVATLVSLPSVAFAASFSSSQIEHLAGIAVGESGADPYSVACVMYNRMQGGWAPKYVHRAFYAKWVNPTPEQFVKIKNILTTGIGCNLNAWYSFASYEIVGIKNLDKSTFLFESGGNSFYSKGALK